MMTFALPSTLKLPAAGSLKRRRMMHTLRRIAAAACAGLAVLFALQTVTSLIATVPVVVASHTIKRGSTIKTADVMIRHIPPRAVSDSMLSSIEEVTGRIAYIDIADGDPVLQQMAHDAPVVPQGATVLDVQLTSVARGLTTSDHVQLVSAMGCQSTQNSRNDSQSNNAQKSPADTADASASPDTADDSAVAENCVLADDAMVMGISTTADSSYNDGRQLVSFAMPPDAAARVLQFQEAGAIVAVMQ
ncbi:flagella basal body P-ring formation protein FlgA [Bifidobacterium sp. LC6]|uniref:Flagella basal body P-ring formation protein FlgA n=1 Tax=Bifidobacterium colobi TaxID=2809026 RepID=A0ABS5USZ7_9BIFI|nr:flagella basal body P-ring formation protein FlgA [Bifidobacterium colobi]MBT1173936.1 flagella basal body P-ring formation protein FlgA [Bifidobacterium colobi]